MRFALIALAALVLGGCTTYDLPPEWRPLTSIVERPSLPFASDTATTTIGSKVYTEDLDLWLKDFPPGSVRFHALMLHEREHARRQFRYKGLPREIAKLSWIMRYLSDRKFMLREEQAGYYLEIRYLFENGPWDDRYTLRIAKNLSTYKTFPGGKRMINFESAKRWIEDVLHGRWEPE